MAVKDKASSRGELAAVFQLDQQRFEGRITPEFYERYKVWGAGT